MAGYFAGVVPLRAPSRLVDADGRHHTVRVAVLYDLTYGDIGVAALVASAVPRPRPSSASCPGETQDARGGSRQDSSRVRAVARGFRTVLRSTTIEGSAINIRISNQPTAQYMATVWVLASDP